MTKERKSEYLRIYAAAFRAARERVGASLDDVAAATGLSKQAVANFERRCCEPGAVNFSAMMVAVGVDPGRLVTRVIKEMNRDD